MRSLMSNIVMVLLAALTLPLVTGEIRPAKNRWVAEESIAAGFCQVTLDHVERSYAICG